MPIASAPSLYAAVVSVAAHEVQDPTLVYCNPDPPVEFGAWGVDVPIAWKDVFHVKAILRAVAANLVRS